MNTNHSTDKQLRLIVLARVYLRASFFFSDHGSAKPGELTGFLQYGDAAWVFVVSKIPQRNCNSACCDLRYSDCDRRNLCRDCSRIRPNNTPCGMRRDFFAPKLFVRQGRAPLGARHRLVGYCPRDHYPLEQCGPSAWSLSVIA